MTAGSETLLDQLRILEELIPKVDVIYAHLTRTLKQMSPILKKKMFNSEDRTALKEYLHMIHQDLDQYQQLIRRGEGERDFLRTEMMRLKKEKSEAAEKVAIAEAELWSAEQNLLVREKGLAHLNELIQLLDSILRVGEMTDFDERLLTEIVMDLKNLSG